MKRLLAGFLILALSACAVQGAIVHVDKYATGGNNGTTWANAYTDLQFALIMTGPGNEIWIARGTYYTTAGFNRDTSFQMKSNVKLYGSFDGTETSVGQRDFDKNETILSGEINTPIKQDNAYHVINCTGASGVTIDGFTITRGYAWNSSDDTDPSRLGGGLVVHDSDVSPQVVNCKFVDNAANYRGGAIAFNYNAIGSVGPVISNCLFEGNYTFRNLSTAEGGAIYMYHHKPLAIIDTTFIDNYSSYGDGGAVYAEHCDVSMDGCTFARNYANYGGGAYLERVNLTAIEPTTISDCKFYDNSCQISGPGLYWARSSYTEDVMSNCWFYGNSSQFYNWSALRLQSFRGLVTDCVFSDNRSYGDRTSGGAIATYLSDCLIRKTALVGNQSIGTGWGGAMMTLNSSVRLENVVSAGNRSEYGGAGLTLNAEGTAQNHRMINCTIAMNESTYSNSTFYGGAGIYTKAALVYATNTLIYGNSTRGAGKQVLNSGTTLAFVSCGLEGGLAAVEGGAVDGGGNVSGDPGFLVRTGTWSIPGAVDDDLCETTFTDSDALWQDGKLAGRFLRPNSSSDMLLYYITTNSANSITVLGRPETGGSNYEIHDLVPGIAGSCTDAGSSDQAPLVDYAGTARPEGPAFDIGAYEFIYDAAAPKAISGLVATVESGQIRFDWTNPTNSDFSGILILRSESAIPTGPPVSTNRYLPGDIVTDGEVVYVGTATNAGPGGASSWTDTDLVNGTPQYYSVFAYDGKPNYSAAATTNGTPSSDSTAPGDVTGLSAVGGKSQIRLNWTNPADSDLKGVLILRKPGSTPPSSAPSNFTPYFQGGMIGDATVVYVGEAEGINPSAASGWTDIHGDGGGTGLSNASDYAYSVFTYDEAPNYSVSAATAAATTDTDAAAPDPVQNLTADAGLAEVELTWWNPSDSDFSGVLILRKAGSAPTGAPTDTNGYSIGQTIGNAIVAYVGTGSSGETGILSGWTDSGLTNGTHYYYSVFAMDDVPNYSAAESADDTPRSAGVVFVNWQATGAGNGISWQDAYTDLQAAFVFAIEGSQIWIAKGTYKPTVGFDRSSSFTMKSGFHVLGGFTNGMNSASERDWEKHETILSGEINSAEASDNSLHVITWTGAEDAILDGVTVTRGYAWDSNNDADPMRDGGAIVLYNSQVLPTILNSRFIDNGANFKGGAIFIDYVSASMLDGPIISNCYFEGNYTFRDSADANGGAIFTWHRMRLQVLDCEFKDNRAENGGAIHCRYADPIIKRCTFSYNYTLGGQGGAIYHNRSDNDRSGSSILEDCDFFANTCANWGGGAYWERRNRKDDIISNCRFFNNGAAQGPNATGLLLLQFGGVVENCVFSGNSAGAAGNSGALVLQDSDGIVRNCIVVGNSSDHRGAGIFCDVDAVPTFQNVISAGNKCRYDSPGICLYDILTTDVVTPSVINCTLADNYAYDLGSGYGGGGLYAQGGPINIKNTVLYRNRVLGSGNQAFINAASGDFESCVIEGGLAGIHLEGGGLAIDSGGNTNTDPLFVESTGSWTADAVYDDETGRTLLSDATESWKAGQLAGFCVNPATNAGVLTYYIETNTESTITVLGNVTAGATAPYRLTDYRVQIDSPCVDGGIPASIITDFNGTLRPQGTAFDIGVYEYIFDSTAPDDVSALTATGEHARVEFSWTNPTNSDFEGILVLRRIGAPPSSPPVHSNVYSVGDIIDDAVVAYVDFGTDDSPGIPSEWTDTDEEGSGLTNGTEYYYTFHSYDRKPNYSSGNSLSVTPAADSAGPIDVLGLSITGGDLQVDMTWTNPADGDFKGVMIIRTTDARLGSPIDGRNYFLGDPIGGALVLYMGTGLSGIPGAASGYTDSALSNATAYKYKIFAYDELPNYSPGIETNAATLPDTEAPGPVTLLTADQDDASISFSWVNASASDFAGVLILRRASAAPTGVPSNAMVYALGSVIGDSTVAYAGPGSNHEPAAASGWTDTGLSNNVTYHYSVHAIDEVPNYASGVSISAVPAVSAVLYVNHAATGLNNGVTWADAFTNMQDAINAATLGRDIWVAEGTYKPGISRTNTFDMKAGVDLFGGFTNGMSSVYDRNWDLYPSVLSGDLDGDGTLNGGNSYHVLRASGSSALDGFTVTMGYADGASDPHRGGGAMYLWHTSTWSPDDYPIIRNCRFVNNAGYIYGGALSFRYNDGGPEGPVISNCVFTNNFTWYSGIGGGGAVYGFHRRPIVIENCEFYDNRSSTGAAGAPGGAAYIHLMHSTIRNCTFARNVAWGRGGAVYNKCDALFPVYPATVEDCRFFANQAYVHGAGLYMERAYFKDDVIRNCQFWANESTDYGGAGLAVKMFDGTIEDCIFSGNLTGDDESFGGALQLEDSDCDVKRCVVVGTPGLSRGGGIHALDRSRPKLENVLIAGNYTRYDGGGICFYDLDDVELVEAELINCTIALNRTTQANAVNGGGGVFTLTENGLAELRIQNSIIWSNRAAGSGDQIHLKSYPVDIDLSHNDIAGGLGGIYNGGGSSVNDLGGNIETNPLFFGWVNGGWTASGDYDSDSGVTKMSDNTRAWERNELTGKFLDPDTAGGDGLLYYIASNSTKTIWVLGDAAIGNIFDPFTIYDFRLDPDSASIDSGTSPAPSTDLLGNSRAAGSIDMGAYEGAAYIPAPRGTVLLIWGNK